MFHVGFSHPIALDLDGCICGQLIDLMRVHFQLFSLGKCIETHDVIYDVFVSIVKDVKFHVSEETHVFSSTSF